MSNFTKKNYAKNIEMFDQKQNVHCFNVLKVISYTYIVHPKCEYTHLIRFTQRYVCTCMKYFFSPNPVELKVFALILIWNICYTFPWHPLAHSHWYCIINLKTHSSYHFNWKFYPNIVHSPSLPMSAHVHTIIAFALTFHSQT